MSYALGCRIRELRVKSGISQESIAEHLEMSRQRYARLEKGQIDISYVMIQKIAGLLGVTTKDITSVLQESKELVTLFREKNNCDDALKAVEKVQHILEVFYAHEKLYYQMKEKEK